jgi:hypothetical protein
MIKHLSVKHRMVTDKLSLNLIRTVVFAAIIGGSIINSATAKEGGGHGGSKSGGHSSGSSHSDEEKGHKGSGGKGHNSEHGGAKAVEGKVLRGGGSGLDSRRGGGRPVWADDGIPEVELGRLNVARSPSHVLDKALAEAHTTLSKGAQASLHSPLQNLALYKEAMSGKSGWTKEQAARFLGAAADKNIPISTDTVKALNTILGLPTENVEEIAKAAEQQRINFKATHDAAGGEGGH